MKKYIQKLDVFGEMPKLLIKNEIRHHSLFGGLMTLVLICISIVAFCLFAQELFIKTSPSVNLSTQTNSHPDQINYFNNFEFLIGIQNKNNIVEINESIFYAKGYISRTTVNETGTFNMKYEIDLEPCSDVLVDSIHYELFKHLNLKGFFCISKHQSKVNISDIYINEFWGNNNFQMIQIKFYQCNNKTMKCADQDTIDSYLHLTELSLFTIDTLIETRDYSNPFEQISKESFFYVSNSFKVSITEYISHLEMNSDDGFLFTTNSLKGTFKQDSIIDYTLYQDNVDTFISFSIQLNNIKEVYYRKYYKIQDLLAQVGGIYKAIFMIMEILMNFYVNHSYFERLINKYYFINLAPPLPNTATSTLNKFEITNTNSLKNITPKSSIRTSNENKFLKQKKNKLRLSFNEKFFSLSICTKHENINTQLYIKGKNTLSSFLDIDNYLKSVHQVQIIDHILFSEKQKKLIEYAFTPVLGVNSIGEVSNVYKEVVVDSYFSKVVKDKLKDYNDIIENYCNKSNKVKVNNFCN